MTLINQISEAAHFQPIILSGGSGSRMHPLVTDHPKALLPISNRPMIFYQLFLLEQSGFDQAIIVTNESAFSKISNYVLEIYPHDPLVTSLRTERNSHGINTNICRVADGIGTLNSLQKISDIIYKDFIVISGDVLLDINLSELADVHRLADASMTILAFEKKRDLISPAQQYFGLVKDSDPSPRAVFYEVAADVEDCLILPNSLSKRYNRISLRTDLLDAHVYVFSNWVIKLIKQMRGHSSLQTELVPYLVRKQFSFAANRDGKYDKFLADWTPFRSEKDKVICKVCIKPASTFMLRVNTTEAYMDANRDVASGPLNFIPKADFNLKDGTLQKAGEKCSVTADCVIGESVQIGDRTSIKKSVIGDHCKISSGSKLINCVLMDHVVIEENCNIQGSVLCSNSNIQKGVTLKDCQVAKARTIQSETEAKNEIFAEVRRDADEEDDIFA